MVVDHHWWPIMEIAAMLIESCQAFNTTSRSDFHVHSGLFFFEGQVGGSKRVVLYRSDL